MMYKVINYKNKPAIIFSANDTTAIIIYMVEENNVIKAKMETIYDKTLLSDYSCPHAEQTVPARIYCVDGKCTYCMESPGNLSFMCSICNVESMMKEEQL